MKDKIIKELNRRFGLDISPDYIGWANNPPKAEEVIDFTDKLISQAIEDKEIVMGDSVEGGESSGGGDTIPVGV